MLVVYWWNDPVELLHRNDDSDEGRNQGDSGGDPYSAGGKLYATTYSGDCPNRDNDSAPDEVIGYWQDGDHSSDDYAKQTPVSAARDDGFIGLTRTR